MALLRSEMGFCVCARALSDYWLVHYEPQAGPFWLGPVTIPALFGWAKNKLKEQHPDKSFTTQPGFVSNQKKLSFSLRRHRNFLQPRCRHRRRRRRHRRRRWRQRQHRCSVNLRKSLF